MELKKNQLYQGFELKDIDLIKEINSTAYIFEHKKTKAKLLFLKNDNKDKTFSVSFRTPPYDNTGLPHILEHSVLCGSKNYPIKDLFGQVVKSSIQSFINAFTFPDKTMYPFSTTNDAEFKKIMKIYLDAVFFPNIHKHKEIFLQEGWRYELEDINAPLKYSGVVYGEMKGALSAPSRIIESYSQRELFPNTSYGVESGGDPQSIPDLKHKDFLEYHKKYYHPSNSYMYIYGDTNIIEDLKLINEQYLSQFEYLEIDSKIKFQTPFEKSKQKTIQYPISKNENDENKYQYGKYYVIDKATNEELMLGFDMLSSILMDHESSPLKKELLKAQLGEDVHGGFVEDMTYQPIFSISLTNSKKDQQQIFTNIIEQTLTKLKQEGIDKQLIKAVINKKEFQLKEEKYINDNGIAKGILINIKVLDSWLYDANPLKHIKYRENLDNIKSKIDKNYFEDLIEKYLLKNNHNVLMTLKPNKKLNPQLKEEQKLAKIKENLSNQELEQIIEQTKKVKKFQEQEDSKQQIDTLKVLQLSDIEDIPYYPKFEKKSINNLEIYEFKTQTNGINYFNLYFDLKKIPKEKLQYLSIFIQLLEETKTKNYGYDEFANLINTYTGDLDFEIKNLETIQNENNPKLVISTKILEENYNKLVTILNEFFSNVIFEQDKVKEVIKKIKSRYENAIINSGHIYAITVLESQYSQSGKFNEIINGISNYKFIKNLDENFDKTKDNIISILNEIYNSIFNKENLILNVTSTNFDLENLDQIKLKQEKTTQYEHKFELKKDNLGIIIPSQVNYVSKGYSLNLLDKKYHGSLLILSNLIRYTYIWENIRIKGGAYGGGGKVTRFGNFALFSYRDPNLKRTLEVYDDFSNYLEKLELDEKGLRKNIIGTISSLDTPLTIEKQSKYYIESDIRGIDFEFLKKERQEVLNTKLEDLQKLSKIIKNAFEKDYHITIGNQSSIEKNKDLFDKIEYLF